MTDSDQPRPQTYDEHVTYLADLEHLISRLQFQTGYWIARTLELYGVDKATLADDINMPYSTLCERLQVYTFWRVDEEFFTVSTDLLHRLAMVAEARRAGALNYTHYRDVMRMVRKQQPGADHITQLEAGVTLLEKAADEKQSVFGSRVAAVLNGEEHQTMSKVWDSGEWHQLAAQDISSEVIQQVRSIRQRGKEARVVVYEVAPDA